MKKLFGYRAQAIVEFAIVLPILMALLVGIFEVGRMVFIYAAVTNASREAVRYASAIGRDDSGYEKYRYCAGIRALAKRSAYFMNLSDADITITYDTGPSTSSFGTCDLLTVGEDPDISVDTGDRVQVTVQADYEPMLRLIPINPRTFTSSSARTILGIFELDSSGAATSTSGPAPTSTFTSIAPSNTPTATATVPSPTSTATVPVVIVTFTPLPTNTQTLVPTFTPTRTPTVTSTPTITSTPVTGCGNITRSAISVPGASGNKSMSMTITNPNSYSVTISTVQVTWNSATGGPGSSLLTLQSATLGSVFWSGSNSTGTLTITPSTTLTIAGNGTTSTIIFTFDKNYQTTGSPSITINLSTPGCESTPIHRP